MIRRTVLPVLLGAVLLGGLPALADENGSSEQQKVQRACSAPADSHYSAPTSSDCKKTPKGKYKGDGNYTATFYSNDVKCGEKNAQTPANPTGIRFYAGGDTSPSGGMGICSDGSGAAPLQGRVGVKGGASGIQMTVDGDKDNAGPSQATGYAIVKVGPGGASVACGKGYGTGGNGDTDNPSDANQANCG